MRFTLPTLNTGESVDRNVVTRKELLAVGEPNLDPLGDVAPNNFLSSHMRGWSVLVRASVVRAVEYKLLGIGICAALVSISPHIGRHGSFSCAMAAAVNMIAASVYWHIRSVRVQVWRGSKYDPWTAPSDRTDEVDALLSRQTFEQTKFRRDEQNDQDKSIIFLQEVMVDGLRYVDWLVTLGSVRCLTLKTQHNPC